MQNKKIAKGTTIEKVEKFKTQGGVINMKKKLLFLLGICFLLFPFSTGNTAEGLSINGYDWQEWDEGEQQSFVIGWVKCGNEAVDRLRIPFDKNIFINMNAQLENFKDEGVLIQGVTAGQVVDMISKIYSDPRVKNMDITDIMPFVSGRLIQGWTEKELDEVIAIDIKLKQCAARKGKLNEECVPLGKEKNSYLEKLRKK